MAAAAVQRYVVTKPFRATVGDEEIRLEAGETIPGPRVPEVESWGRSIHFLINTNKLAPITVKAQDDLTNEELVADRGVDLLEYFSDDELLAELAERGVEAPTADVDEVETEGGSGDGGDGTPADAEPETVEDVDLMKLTRPVLNELATERGITDPGSFPTKQALVDAIAAAEPVVDAEAENAGDGEGGSGDGGDGTPADAEPADSQVTTPED